MDREHLEKSARNHCCSLSPAVEMKLKLCDCEALKMDLWTAIKLDLLQGFCIGFSAKMISRLINYSFDKRQL